MPGLGGLELLRGALFVGGAMRTITFDADDVIQNLDIIRRVQMPFVASWALNQL